MMNNTSHLKIAPEYVVHIVREDEVVILYNQRRPLILNGHDMVQLFEFFEGRQFNLVTAEDLMALPEHLILRVARLLKENVLQYADSEKKP